MIVVSSKVRNLAGRGKEFRCYVFVSLLLIAALVWNVLASQGIPVGSTQWDGGEAYGAKLGRQAIVNAEGGGLDLFAGMGWSWNYDAGVRLSYAASGRGDLEGRALPDSLETYRYEYGKGDELKKIIRESEGKIDELEIGTEGRITARNGTAFVYDKVGRRTEDDRFAYLWNWRSELVSVTVKDEASPFAGHQVRYEYDALGRMTIRWYLGRLPEGESDESLRPFIEKRVYVWEGDGLLAEVGYADPDATQMRWRKTYVPGAGGLDDAIQVAVETFDLPGTPFPGQHLYTYLRDELGTVIGLVAEDEGTPATPAMPVRYIYSPYGEAHVETGPELRHALFINELTQLGQDVQGVADETLFAEGALAVNLSMPLDPASLTAGVAVEQRQAGGVWQPVADVERVVGSDPNEPTELVVLLRSGWQRGSSYRVRLGPGLQDSAGRALARSESLEWGIPEKADGEPVPPVVFEQRFSVPFESYAAAFDNVGGRIPGGQTSLFQGLWTDPVTGIAYARARWYDARNASFLTEDPYADVDSPNLYAFVAWQPNMATDPLGLSAEKEKKKRSWLAMLSSVGDSISSIGRSIGDFVKDTIDHSATPEQAMAAGRAFGRGMVNGALDTASGYLDIAFAILWEPRKIPQKIRDTIADLKKVDFGKVAEYLGTSFADASDEEKSEMIGNLVGGVAMDFLFSEGIGAAGKAATKAIRAARAANEAAEIAADAVRVEAKIAGVGAKAEEAAGAATRAASKAEHTTERLARVAGEVVERWVKRSSRQRITLSMCRIRGGWLSRICGLEIA